MNKNLFSKCIVALVILMNTCFTVTVLYIFRKVGSEPTALIAAWFSFTTGELWMLASIKKKKVKHNYDEINNINEEEVESGQTTNNQKINEP